MCSPCFDTIRSLVKESLGDQGWSLTTRSNMINYLKGKTNSSGHSLCSNAIERFTICLSPRGGNMMSRPLEGGDGKIIIWDVTKFKRQPILSDLLSSVAG